MKRGVWIALALIAGCEAKDAPLPFVPPPPSTGPGVLRFKLEPLEGGAWRGSYDRAAFRIEIQEGQSPHPYARGLITAVPKSEPYAFLKDLAKAHGVRGVPAPRSKKPGLTFSAAMLGRDLSLGGAEVAGRFSTTPQGTWIATRALLTDVGADFYLNLDTAGGLGEFVLTDPTRGHLVLREFRKVF
jgi:hypothetical protein